MERETVPRCFSTAVTATWGTFCTVLNLLSYSLPWTLLLTAPFSQPQAQSTAHLWWIHSFSTQIYSPFCPSPMNNPTGQLSYPWNSSSAYFLLNACSTLYRALLPKPYPLDSPLAGYVIATATARCWILGMSAADIFLKIMIPRCLVLPIKVSSECCGAAWTKYWRTCLS